MRWIANLIGFAHCMGKDNVNMAAMAGACWIT